MTSVDPLVRFERKLHCARLRPGSVKGTRPRIGSEIRAFGLRYGMTGDGIAIGIECKPFIWPVAMRGAIARDLRIDR